MKRKYLKLKNWLLVSLGGLLGLNLAGCNNYPIACEYGVPEATFHVKGTVTNENGEPLQGIGVGRQHRWDEVTRSHYTAYLDTTDENGRYEVNMHSTVDPMIYLAFDDIDGERNGSYLDTIVEVRANQGDFHGGDGHWNEGTADIELDVVMHPAKE